MGDAIGPALAFAIAIALSPFPIVGVVLVLNSPRARANAPAFLLGWLAGLLVAGALVLAIGAGAHADDSSATWVSVLQLVLGAIFLVLAVKQWRGRPRGNAQPKTPVWMKAVDTFTARRSAALAVALAAINPKNLVLVVGGMAAIAQSDASTGAQAVALVVFCAIATLGIATPIALSYALGARSQRLLDALNRWMSRHGSVVAAVIFVVIAAKLIADGIGGVRV